MQNFTSHQAAVDALTSGEIKAGDRFTVDGRQATTDGDWITYPAYRNADEAAADGQPREWTDERDALAYDTFRELADLGGVAFAQRTMRGLQRTGTPFAKRDLIAWIQRYVDEHVTSCEWDTMCDQGATTTRSHPDRGEVPVCGGCGSSTAESHARFLSSRYGN